MMLNAAFAALVEARLGPGWRRAPDVAGMDDHLRRDIGLPPLGLPRDRMGDRR